MVKKKINIEDLFKNEFEHFEVQPSDKVWNGIRSGLIRRHFMQFNLDSFNIYYLSAIIIAGTLTVISLTVNKNDKKETLIQNQTNLETLGFINPAGPLLPDSDAVHPEANSSVVIENTPVEKSTPVKSESKPIQPVMTVNPQIAIISKGDRVRKTETIKLYAPDKVLYTSFSPSAREGCAPLTVNFTNQSENAIAYAWNFGDGGFSTERNPTYIFDEPGTYLVSLSVNSAGNEINTFTDSIHVYPLPDADFKLDKDAVPGSGQPVYFYNYSKGADYFGWNFGDGNTSIQKDPVHYYERTGNYNVTLIAESVHGCRDSVVLKNAFAEKEPDVIFPNAFSPNRNGPSDGYYSRNDSRNEVFHPYIKENVEEYQLKIFNRTGLLIFESNDINIGWDGYYHQTLMPQGVYIWKVRGRFASGRSFVKMGDVTLLWTQQR